MSDPALDTLFLPLDHGFVSGPRAAVLNARLHPALSIVRPAFLQQCFKPYVLRLEKQGYAVLPTFPDADHSFDTVFVVVPKNMDEARHVIAQGLVLLRDGGFLVAAAANDAGGGRLKKIYAAFDVTDCSDLSKNRARVVWGRKSGRLNAAVVEALHKGGVQAVIDETYVSQPGIFGWDKIDSGSQILLQQLEGGLAGAGADFGCGYGYLSCAILRRFSAIKVLHCIDADWRAVQACQSNTQMCGARADMKYHWEDLTKPVSGLAGLDWIVMNPPFHEGRKSDIGIGRHFIETAHHSLKRGGVLWMVANIHMPYEQTLRARFETGACVFDGGGFKVFCARK